LPLFLKNRKQLIDTAYNNLKKDGWLFLHTFDKADKNIESGLTEKEIKDMLGSRFKNVSIKVFDHYDRAPGHNHWHKIMEVTAQRR